MNVPITSLERVLSACGQRGLGRCHSALNARTQQSDFLIGHLPQCVDQRLSVGEQLIDPVVDFCSSFTGCLARCASSGPIEIISRRCHGVPP
jgi:hypothetical protein